VIAPTDCTARAIGASLSPLRVPILPESAPSRCKMGSALVELAEVDEAVDPSKKRSAGT
jgi:hypothetical protein